MIEEITRIHGKNQFEIKLNYEFESGKKASAYKVESFMFVPNSFGINASSYSKKNFYSDIQSYLRFKTPSIQFDQLISGENSPLVKITEAYDQLIKNYGPKTIKSFEHQTKMFNCVFKSSIRDYYNFLESMPLHDDKECLIEQYLNTVQDISSAYRKLRKIITSPVVSENTMSIHSYGDEYISLLMEKFSFKILEHIKDLKLDKGDSYKQSLLKIIREEIDYRVVHNYASVPKADSDNSIVTYRFSILKKYLDSVLFLKIDKRPEGVLLEQVATGAAAGLAMIFATSIAFLGQFKYGALTLPFFIILVFSYIFKDRIKELTRFYFANRISNKLSDHKIKIFANSTKKIGVCRESFNFIKKKNLPVRVLKIRNRDRSQEFDNKFAKEQVIHYKKAIKISPKVYHTIFHDYKISGINDILRFNVSKFLVNMDNPRKEMFLLTPDSYKEVLARRVYHLNMVLKYSLRNETIYKRFRIILSRNRIIRIEPVNIDSY